MEIKHFKKKINPKKHNYFLGVRITKDDFKDEKIKEFVLKIRIPSFFKWTLTGDIQQKEEKKDTTKKE